eukprot:scaffold4560_cov74-Phaeocystis_antarctica.AAC.3
MQVLQHYKFIWQQPAAAARTSPRQIVIVNLQPTPKDRVAHLRIHARCDELVQLLLQQLELPLPAYDRGKDLILRMRVAAAAKVAKMPAARAAPAVMAAAAMAAVEPKHEAGSSSAAAEGSCHADPPLKAEPSATAAGEDAGEDAGEGEGEGE